MKKGSAKLANFISLYVSLDNKNNPRNIINPTKKVATTLYNNVIIQNGLCYGEFVKARLVLLKVNKLKRFPIF